MPIMGESVGKGRQLGMEGASAPSPPAFNPNRRPFVAAMPITCCVSVLNIHQLSAKLCYRAAHNGRPTPQRLRCRTGGVRSGLAITAITSAESIVAV